MKNPIKNHGPKKRDPTCLQTQEDIVIHKGTILRQATGKPGVFKCPVGLTGELVVTMESGIPTTLYKKVIAA